MFKINIGFGLFCVCGMPDNFLPFKISYFKFKKDYVLIFKSLQTSDLFYNIY